MIITQPHLYALSGKKKNPYPELENKLGFPAFGYAAKK